MLSVFSGCNTKEKLATGSGYKYLPLGVVNWWREVSTSIESDERAE
jgi:hypothetical protein